MNFPSANTVEDRIVVPNEKLNKFRDWFKSAVDKSGDWRKEATEDYDFVAGKQWNDEDKATDEKRNEVLRSIKNPCGLRYYTRRMTFTTKPIVGNTEINNLAYIGSLDA